MLGLVIPIQVGLVYYNSVKFEFQFFFHLLFKLAERLDPDDPLTYLPYFVTPLVIGKLLNF